MKVTEEHVAILTEPRYKLNLDILSSVLPAIGSPQKKGPTHSRLQFVRIFPYGRDFFDICRVCTLGCIKFQLFLKLKSGGG